MKQLIAPILLLLFVHAHAQPERAPKVFHLGIRNHFLVDDYHLGIDFGLMTQKKKFMAFTNFDFRPFRKKVLDFQGNNLFYQYAEQRFFIGGGVEFLIPIPEKNYGVFVQANANYTWAFYGGTEVKPPKGWVLVPRLGFFWAGPGKVYLRLGYGYLDTRNNESEKNQIYLSLSGILSKQ